jgi:peptide subunit release factor 1 (eRF1)
LDFSADTADRGRRVGTPEHGPPGEAPVQTGSARGDQFDRALEDHRIRFIGSAAGDVAEAARARGWTRLAVAGDPRLTRPLVEGMPPHADLEVVMVEGTFDWRRPAELAAHLAPALEAAEARRLEELVREAAERAAARGHGAAGAAQVAAALVEGRVDTLIIDPSRHIEGVRAPDGRLAPLGVVPEGADPAELEPEPRLDERMVELAVDGSARVVAVSGRAADLLAEAGGVAAITRW